MHQNKLLDRLRSASVAVLESDPDPAARTLAETCQELDRWLSEGRALPDEWLLDVLAPEESEAQFTGFLKSR